MDVPGQPNALPESVRLFLAAPRFATISTLMPDGSPHQAVVWYGLDGDTLFINSRRGRRWPGNLERDGRIALAIYDDAQPEHWLGIRGVAEVLRDGLPAHADIKALARRYGSPTDQWVGQEQQRITFRINVHSTFEYGDD